LPTTPEAAAIAAASRARAVWAARIGVVRGDLWSQAALTYASGLWTDVDRAADLDAFATESRASIERTLAHAPHQSPIWLLAASLGPQFNWLKADPIAALKMAYYTAPNDIHLLPLRLLTAIKLNALTDAELAQLVRRDARMILQRLPQLRPALAAAYNAASPDTKTFLESLITDIDPTFLDGQRHRP
jgi:hypothetical protein